MKKIIERLLLFILCYLLVFNSTAFADSIRIYFSGNGKKKVDIQTITSGIYSLLYTVGAILAVCILVTIAISYMTATPNKKALLKERLIYYFAGVIFLVGGLAFLRIYEKAAKDVGNIVSGANVGSSTSSGDSSRPKFSYVGDDGEVHYTDDSVEMVSNACKMTKDEISTMSQTDLETFVEDLDFAIKDFKAKLESGKISKMSGMERSIGEAENNLAFARGRLDAFNLLRDNKP